MGTRGRKVVARSPTVAGRRIDPGSPPRIPADSSEEAGGGPAVGPPTGRAGSALALDGAWCPGRTLVVARAGPVHAHQEALAAIALDRHEATLAARLRLEEEVALVAGRLGHVPVVDVVLRRADVVVV